MEIILFRRGDIRYIEAVYFLTNAFSISDFFLFVVTYENKFSTFPKKRKPHNSIVRLFLVFAVTTRP